MTKRTAGVSWKVATLNFAILTSPWFNRYSLKPKTVYSRAFKVSLSSIIPVLIHEVGLDDPCGSFPNQDSLWFYDI